MTSTLLVTLILSVPLAALAWIGAMTVDRARAGLRVRRAVWTLAFIAPLALAPMALSFGALGWSTTKSAPQSIEGAGPPMTPLTAILPHEQAFASPQGLNWPAIVLTFLALGALVRLIVLFRRGLSLASVARRAKPLQGEFGGLAVGLYDGEAPVLVGLIKPKVLLPRALAETLTPSQIALVCAHERAHLRAGDHIANLLEAFAMALFWFNPALGAIRAGLSAVREEACDAAALTGVERPVRRIYAEVLLAAIRHAGGAEPAVAFTGFYRARSARRLRAILTPESKGAKAAAAIAAVVALILTGAAGALSFALAGSEASLPPQALSRLPAPMEVALVATRTPVERRSTPAAKVSATEATIAARPTPSPLRDYVDTSERDTVAALNGLLIETRLGRIQARARLQALQGMNVEAWPEVRRDDVYRQMVKEHDAKVAEVDEARSRFGATHPTLVSLVRQMSGIETTMKRQAQFVQSDMETELKMLEAKERAITEQIAALTNATPRANPTLP